MALSRISSATASKLAGRRAFASASAADAPSFTKSLFAGKLSPSMASYPAPRPEDVELLRQIVEPVTAFLSEKNDAKKNDETHEIPEEVKAGCRELGLYGLMAPESLNGVGLNNSCYARMTEVIGSQDLGLGIHLGSHQSIGWRGVALAGTDAQKEKYIPKLASGEHIAAFVLTEPGAGSDVQSIKTSAKLSADGKHWVINGSKIWISNGGFADFMTVFAKTPITNPSTKETEMKITAFLVERKFGGITAGPPEDKMGIKCSNTCEVYFEDCHVPVENVLGEVGQGFKIAMAILNSGRFGMGAALTGTMKAVIESVTEHVKQRVQFGKKLSEFGSVKGKIATMNARLYATESLAYYVAGQMDAGAKEYQLEAAASKIFASENAWYVTDEAIQLMGGLGFMRSLPYERILRDLRIFRIFEGANDILRQLVGLTGLQAVGKDLAPIQAAMKSPLTNLGVLAPFAIDMVKSKAGMVENPKITWAAPELAEITAVVEEATGKIGTISRDLLMKHGKKIIEAQLPVEKLADAVIETTACAAVLSRATKAIKEKLPTAESEANLAKLYVAEAKQRINANLRAAAGGDSKIFKLKYQVADNAFGKGYDSTHPMGV